MKQNKCFTFLCCYSVFSEIAVNLISVFIPIIIYDKYNLQLSVVYILIVFLIQGIFNIFFKSFLCKHSVLCLMFRVLPIVAINLLININFSSGILCVLMLALCSSFIKICYYVPIAKILSVSIEGSEGNRVGSFRTSMVIGKIIAPIIGGYILVNLSQLILTIICVGLYVAGYIFLISCARGISSLHKDNGAISKTKNLSLNDRTYKKLFLKSFISIFIINFCVGITAVGDKVLPLFCSIENLQISSVGYVVAIFNICDLLSNYISGKISDKRSGYFVAILSCIVYGAIWTTIPFSGAISIFVFSAMLGFCYPFFGVILQARCLKYGCVFCREEQFLSMREYAQQIGGVVTCAIMCIFNSLTLCFICSGVSMAVIVFYLCRDREFNL